MMTLQDERRTVELSVVGSMALNPLAADWAASELQASQFTFQDCRTMFTVVCTMVSAGTPVDPVTLAVELSRRGELERAGGDAGIKAVLEAVPHHTHVKYYGRQLIEFHKRDSMKRMAERLRQSADDSTCEPSETIDAIVSDLEALQTGVNRQSDLIDTTQALAQLDRREQDSDFVLSTGLPELDALLRGGLRPGQLIVVGGRPGLGKSSLMAQFVLSAALEHRPCVIASLEMEAGEIAERALAMIARQRFAELPVWFSQASDFEKLQAQVRLAKRQRKIELAAVDYLQLIESPASKNDLRERQVAVMSRGLKRLAMAQQIPILLGSQLNRESEKRGRPSLADLRESGSIEQDADIVILIAGDTENDERELIVAKHRGGPCGLVRVSFDRPKFWFRDSVDWAADL